MAITTFTAAQVLTAAQMNAVQSNDFNQTVSTKTASYTLVAADKGTRIVMNVASANTVTVNTSLFSAGDTLTIQNIGAGPTTVTAGTATVSSSGMLVIPTNGSGLLYFTSASAAIFYPSALEPTTNRNVVINGAMQVAQRGTSTASITADGYYTADRFKTACSGIGTFTQSIENDAPTGSGFRKSLKMLCTTADASPSGTDNLAIFQQFEGQNVQQFLKGTASAKSFAVSFWVKSNVTGTYIAELFDTDNNRQTSISYTISASATWEKKTIIFASDTTGAFDNDNAVSLQILFWLGAGPSLQSGTLQTTWASNTSANRAVGQTNLASAINNYWQITGVQLEVGSVATPFEFEDYGITLTKCQRYYCRVIAAYLGVGLAYSTTSTSNYVNFPTTMRVAPSAVETTGTAANYLQVLSNTGTQTCNAVPVFVRASSDTAEVTATSASTGLVQGNATFLLASGGTPYLGFSAEL